MNRFVQQCIAVVTTGLMLALLLIVGSRSDAATGGVEATNEVPRWMTRVCVYEDSVNCQWNASSAGNGRGDSFYVRHFPNSRLTCVIYIDRPAKDYCFKEARR